MNQVLASEDLIVNLVTRQVTQSGIVLSLPDLSYQTLVALIQLAPKTVSIDQLVDKVWEDIEISPETVTQRIALLRKSLNANSSQKTEYISSIRNKGYRWVPVVKTINQRKNKNKLKQWGVLFLIILMGVTVTVYYLSLTKKQSGQVQKSNNNDEFLTQAQRYLNKHDLPSNKIAVDLFRKSLASDPQNSKAMIGISLALSHQVTKYNQPNDLLDEAKQFANKSIKLNPDNSNSWIALGFVYDANGEIDKAIDLYEKGLELNPIDDSTISSLAYLYTQKGRLVEAMQLNISALGSKQPYLNLQIANTLELLGFDSVAEHWYKKADELSPDNVFATHQMARFYISHDQNTKAKEIIESAINRGINRPELSVLLGIIDLMNGNKNQARINFDNALKVDAHDLEASVWKKIVSQTNRLEVNWFEESANWPDVEVFKALNLAHNNKYDEAVLSLEKAYESGYINHNWLKKLPPFYPIKEDPGFLKIIETMQNDTSKQRHELLNAEWLPASFLDPQKY